MSRRCCRKGRWMTIFDFIDKHPWLTFFLLLLVFDLLGDLIKAWRGTE